VEHKELQDVLRKGGARHRGQEPQRRREAPRGGRPVLAAGAARLAGDMQIAEAGPALTRLLSHHDAPVRLAAVEAAVTLKASTVAAALVQTLEDPEREVRIAAAKALGALQYRPAAKALVAS
jgi:HEAT repeat protein